MFVCFFGESETSVCAILYLLVLSSFDDLKHASGTNAQKNKKSGRADYCA